MKADATDVSHVLQGGDQYIVPLFQRTYIWQYRQWTNLWEDIMDLLEENPRPEHFLGSIVCAAVDNQLGKVPSYIIVDGQQRLVTLISLLCALRDATESKPSISSLAGEIQDNYLIHKYKEGYERYKLLPRTSYRDSFFDMIEERTRSGQQDSIKTAYNFFKERLSADDFSEARLKEFYIAITQRLKLVLITLAKEENPFPIFEALNSTGIKLLQSDMIRNFVFMKMNLDEQNAFDSNEWQPLENLFTKTNNLDAAPLDNFYKHYLMSSGEYLRDDEIYVKFKEKMKGRDAHQIVTDLRPLASFYLQFNQPELGSDSEIRVELSRILELNQPTCFPLLLNLFVRNTRNELERAMLLRLLRAIQSFILRRQVLGLTTRPYGKWFTEMSGLITQKLELGLYQRFVIRGWPGDAEFISALSKFEIYKSGIDKMILAAIEESLGKKSIDTSSLRVEHVMPQSISDDEEGQSWKRMLGPRWQEVHGIWSNTLGNLTLTRHNHELGRFSFPEKKAIYADSKLVLNKYFENIDRWGENEIKTRANSLAAVVATIWPRELT